MPTIDQLSLTTALYDTDKIPVFSPFQEDTRAATLPQIAAYVLTAIEGEPDETVYSITTNGSGFVAAILPLAVGGWVWGQFSLSGAASTGTIILPGIDDRTHGQEVLVTITQPVATLTVSGNGATVRGAPTSLLADGFFRLKYDSISNQWFRIG